METKINIVTKNLLYKRANTFSKLDGIVISSAPIANTPINNFIDSLDRGYLFPKCPHFFVRHNGVVYQFLPENYKTKYCGGYCDSHYIQILLCEPTGTQYTSTGVCSVGDIDKAKLEFDIELQSATELIVNLCKKYSLDPMKKDVILSQNEAYKAKMARNYPGIDHILNALKVGNMDTLRDKVNHLLINGSSALTDSRFASTNQQILNVDGGDNTTRNVYIGNPTNVSEIAFETKNGTKVLSHILDQDQWFCAGSITDPNAATQPFSIINGQVSSNTHIPSDFNSGLTQMGMLITQWHYPTDIGNTDHTTRTQFLIGSEKGLQVRQYFGNESDWRDCSHAAPLCSISGTTLNITL